VFSWLRLTVTHMDKRPALGKGLSALIPDEPELRTTPAEIDIDSPVADQFQRGASVDDAKLEELTRSSHRTASSSRSSCAGRRSLSDHRGRSAAGARRGARA